MFWTILAAVVIVYAANTVFSIRQMKDFSSSYSSLRRRGKVAIGKQKNALTSGAIVMFLLDSNGRIIEGKRLTGITVWSRFKSIHQFDGQPMADVDPSTLRAARSLRRAVANARDNYLTVQTGGIPVEPPEPLMKVINRIDGKVRLPGGLRSRGRRADAARPARAGTGLAGAPRRTVVRRSPAAQ